MAKNPKSYTPEFRQQIVDLYNAGGTSYPILEREYGINQSTLSNWVNQLSPINGAEGECVTLKEYDTERIILHSDLGSQYTSQAFESCYPQKG